MDENMEDVQLGINEQGATFLVPEVLEAVGAASADRKQNIYFTLTYQHRLSRRKKIPVMCLRVC